MMATCDIFLETVLFCFLPYHKDNIIKKLPERTASVSIRQCFSFNPKNKIPLYK